MAITTGLQTLHYIDAAINTARKSVSKVSVLPNRVSQSLIDVQRQQMRAYEQVASDRLALIDAGGGGQLGYVDRQADKLLEAHSKDILKVQKKITASVSKIEKLETKRRTQEKAVAQAVDSYDKAAALTEAKILKDAYYITQLDSVEKAELTVGRATEKLELAREDVSEKGAPYRNDPFFGYLQRQQYGTENAKGWFLTKLLDGWVARLTNYHDASENFRRLTAIPARLETHVLRLEELVDIEREKLQTLEDNILQKDGVKTKHKASLQAQKKLEDIDKAIETAEANHQTLRDDESRLTSGKDGPYQDAITLLSDTLQRKDLPSLRRIASQTQTREDDKAVEDLRKLAFTAEDLRDDQSEANKLLKKHQQTLGDLEKVRQAFKARRYDAPSSVFDRGGLITALLDQVLRGVLSGDDFWRQIQRTQRTVRRYSDNDFGGIDWTEGLRLPRTSRRRGGWGSPFPQSGGWGGGGRRRRTSIPRAPRQRLPKISSPAPRRKGGFRTGGGF